MYSRARARPAPSLVPVRVYIIKSYIVSKRTEQRFANLIQKIHLASQTPVLSAEDEEEFHVNCNFNTATVQPNGDLTFLGHNPGGKSLVVVPTPDSQEQDELDTYNHGVPANILGAVLKSNFQAFFCQGGDIYLKFRWDNQPKKFKQIKFCDKMADSNEEKSIPAVNGNYTYIPGLLVFISHEPELEGRNHAMCLDIQSITKTYEKQTSAKTTAVKFEPIPIQGSESPRFLTSIYNQLYVGCQGKFLKKYVVNRDLIDLTSVFEVEGNIIYITPLTLGRLLVFHEVNNQWKPWEPMYHKTKFGVSLLDRKLDYEGTVDLYDSKLPEAPINSIVSVKPTTLRGFAVCIVAYEVAAIQLIAVFKMKVFRLKTLDLSQRSQPTGLYFHMRPADRWRLQDAVWVADINALYLTGSDRLDKLFLRSK